jgi:cold-inducible RNA-binding protein
MNKKVFVANLSYSVSETSLRDLFAEFGEVVSVKIVTDNFTGRSKGFGFVEFATKEEAVASIEGLNNKEVDGRNLKVDWAKPREASPRPAGDRGAMGGNRGGFDRNGGANGGRRRF